MARRHECGPACQQHREKHPHWPKGTPGGKGGQFRPKSASPAPAAAPAAPAPAKASAPPAAAPDRAALGRIVAQLDHIGDDDLAVAYVRIAAAPASPGQALALAALDKELARREGLPKLTVEDDHHARRLDDLIARGASYLDAYAEIHNLDPAALDAQQRAALIDAERRPGERREATLRRMYAQHVYVSYLAAEEATRGNVLSPAGRAKGIDAASLWSGTAARARKYASPELLQWWEAHGGRQNWTQYRAQYVAGGAAAAQASRLAGNARDYGV